MKRTRIKDKIYLFYFSIGIQKMLAENPNINKREFIDSAITAISLYFSLQHDPSLFRYIMGYDVLEQLEYTIANLPTSTIHSHDSKFVTRLLLHMLLDLEVLGITEDNTASISLISYEYDEFEVAVKTFEPSI